MIHWKRPVTSGFFVKVGDLARNLPTAMPQLCCCFERARSSKSEVCCEHRRRGLGSHFGSFKAIATGSLKAKTGKRSNTLKETISACHFGVLSWCVAVVIGQNMNFQLSTVDDLSSSSILKPKFDKSLVSGSLRSRNRPQSLFFAL